MQSSNKIKITTIGFCFPFIPKGEFLLLTFTDLQLLTEIMWMFLLEKQ